MRSKPLQLITALLDDYRWQSQRGQTMSDFFEPISRDGQPAVRRRRIAVHQVEAG